MNAEEYKRKLRRVDKRFSKMALRFLTNHGPVCGFVTLGKPRSKVVKYA